MLKNFIRIIGGDPNKRAVDKLTAIITQINSLEAEFEQLSDDALRAKTDQFRAYLAQARVGITDEKMLLKAEQAALDEILPEAFAVVREASKRTIGLRHYDVQLIGGITLHQGKIAEMRTGEGKTLVATLPLYLNALTGRGVHLITVNDYLARRDARWKAPIYNLLGLSVGVLQMAARTENGLKAFIVDLEKSSPHEDQHQLRLAPRRDAYLADITYGTNSEFGFDYLRDNMTMSLDARVQRRGESETRPYYAIVDEVDNVLIDEARTPLIISGPASDNVEEYFRMAQIVRQLRPEDCEVSERDRNVTLTEIGEVHIEELLGMPLRDPDRPEDVTPEQARLAGYLEQALRAQFLFKRNKEYLVQAGKVIIVDEFTGRLMPGRRWSDGLHQAVEAKEGVKVEAENVTYATITIQNYFRMYQKLAGMSGTALTEAEEFDKIYKLEVLPIPTNLEYQASRPASPLLETEGRDEDGYKFRYYTRTDDTQKTPVFYRRKDYPDVIYRTEEAKFRFIILEILRYHTLGRPVLVGTTSVELSERLSSRLRAEPLRRLAQVQLLRNVWMEKNQREEDGRLIPELKWLNEPLDKLDVSELRKMARELEISFNPEELSNLQRLLILLRLETPHAERLATVLQSGIPHEVLNARKHTEESQIIAGAGSFAAVTIATNMAGRGVDIKLGGELAEEHIALINRVLRRAGHADPYDMSMEQRRQAIKAMDPADYGIYESEVRYFLQHLDEMEQVKTLGGLHIIGSERHEARRIDNQLRGRSARQGDPGSSRFFLSLEDELMVRFGGGQANNLMQRFQIDDAVPMEYGIVSRIVEGSQTRVEGANFDVRKHLLEYDDVLNAQRASIYAQRDRIFVKDDLSEDVTEMLRTELKRRVLEALKDAEGPWKLVAWLEQVQPSQPLGNVILPSYPLKLLVDQLGKLENQRISQHELVTKLVEMAAEALDAEAEHTLSWVRTSLVQAEDRLKSQIAERQDALDTFLEGQNLGEEEAPRSPRELADELIGLLRLPIRLTPEQQRALRDEPRQFVKNLRPVIKTALSEQALRRLIDGIELHLNESIEVNITELAAQDWEAAADQIEQTTENFLLKLRERLIGLNGQTADGQIARDVKVSLAKVGNTITSSILTYLLLLMTEGVRSTFDKKTHRRIRQRTTRLTYVYSAARILEKRDPDQLADDVLAHLEQTQQSIRSAWGMHEFSRLIANRPVDLDDRTQRGLRLALGEQAYLGIQNLSLGSLPAELRQKAIDELGRRALTDIYRQLVLSVITDLWVDYLTQMEALRVAVSLESYAQRDPLVQYKSKAFELYQALIINSRLGVISRMFTFRPRDLSAVQASVTTASIAPIPDEIEGPTAESEAETATLPEIDVDEILTDDSPAPEHSAGSKKKRRRRR